MTARQAEPLAEARRRELVAGGPAARGMDALTQLMKRAREFPDTIVMGSGDPDFDTPAHIVEAAQRALCERRWTCAPAEGLPALREAIADRVWRVNGVRYDPETEVVVTNGGQEAILLMLQAVLRSGDEVLVPEPVYSTYLDAIALTGARKVAIQTFAGENFDLPPDRVEAAITPHTRALVLVSPNNPTAHVLPPERVRQLVKVAARHDLIVIADDIYDVFLYDGAVHLTPALADGGRERTLTTNACSKAYSMTGWRLGWITGPAPLMAAVRHFKAAVSGGTGIVAQMAAVAALTGPQDCLAEFRYAYTRRRGMVLETVRELGWNVGQPNGGQFVLADITHLGKSSLDLARELLEAAHILVYPGAAFAPDYDHYMRITFLQPDPVLAEGLRRLRRAVRELG